MRKHARNKPFPNHLVWVIWTDLTSYPKNRRKRAEVKVSSRATALRRLRQQVITISTKPRGYWSKVQLVLDDGVGGYDVIDLINPHLMEVREDNALGVHTTIGVRHYGVDEVYGFLLNFSKPEDNMSALERLQRIGETVS